MESELALFGKKLQRILFKEGLSQGWLSKESGVSAATISSIIYRDTIPRLDTAVHIVQALEITLDEFLNINSSNGTKKLEAEHTSLRADYIDYQKVKLERVLEQSETNIRKILDDFKKSTAPITAEEERILQANDEQNYARAQLALSEDARSEYTGTEKVRIPFIENLAAGNPRAVNYERKTLDIEKSQLPKGSAPATLVALKLDGSSMVNLGFHDTDIVLVDQDLPAKDNDLVMAYIHAFDGCTFKRLTVSHFRGEDGKHRKEYLLVWEDGSKKTHTIDPIDDAVIGVYVGRITKQ